MSNGVDFRKLALDLRDQLSSTESQLAALREELADIGDELQLTAEERDHAKRNSSAFEDRMGSLQCENGKLQQRLADAERRNAELSGLLRESFPIKGSAQELADLKARIDAALNNPEEAKS